MEAPSELQVARADAFKKTHAVQEKGLPSFAEFGTKDMLLYEDDSDEDEPGNDREPTLKAGLMVPGQDDRRGRGRHSAGSGSAYSRSPSPQLMPPSRDPSPMGRVPSPHISPLRERSYAYDQYQHSPQHGTGQNLGSYYSDRPAADPAWRSSSYGQFIAYKRRLVCRLTLFGRPLWAPNNTQLLPPTNFCVSTRLLHVCKPWRLRLSNSEQR